MALKHVFGLLSFVVALSSVAQADVTLEKNYLCSDIHLDTGVTAEVKLQRGIWQTGEAVQTLKIMANVSVKGKAATVLTEECSVNGGTGMKCVSIDGDIRYEIYPKMPKVIILPEDNRIEKVGVVVWNGSHPESVMLTKCDEL